MSTFPSSATDSSIRPRILLVEDNDAAGRGLARLLEACGFDVTVRADGASALRALESPAHFDFLLTDLRLPDMDGRDIAQHARSLVPTPRIALITGWDLDDELRDYTSMGIEWVFTKPLEIRDLIARLREPPKPR